MNLIRNITLILPVYFFSAGCMAAATFNDHYIGVDYGLTFLNTGISSVSDDIDYVREGKSLKVVFGHNFSREVALELIYIDMGEGNLTGPTGGQFTFDGTQVDLIADGQFLFKTTGYGLNGVFVTEITRSVSMDLKLGVLFWDRSLTVSNLSTTATFDAGDTGSDLYMGIGFNYGWGPVLLSVGAESYQFNDLVLDSSSRIYAAIEYGFSF